MPSVPVPYDEHEEAERRKACADWLDAASVGARIGKVPSEVTALRKEGALLGAWLPSGQRFLYPPWQFGERGNPIPEVTALLTLLRSPNGMDIGLPSTGWGEVEWFISYHVLLDGLSPAQVLESDPARVLAVAQEEFAERSRSR